MIVKNKLSYKEQERKNGAPLSMALLAFGITLQMSHAMELEKDSKWSPSFQTQATLPHKLEGEIDIEALVRRSYGSSMTDKLNFITKLYNGFIPEFYLKGYNVDSYFNQSLAVCSMEEIQFLNPQELYLIYLLAEPDHWPKDFIHYIETNANEGEDPFHQNLLGVMHANGRGCVEDHALAIEWFLKAETQGLPEASYNIGVNYDCGTGVEKNGEEALVHYTNAATKGHAFAQIRLGSESFQSKDFTEALNWFSQAADQGAPYAQYRMALNYENGDGVPIDYAKSTAWCLKAAEGGLHDAQFDLYGRYCGQLDGVQNEREYKKWMKKAEQQGPCSLSISLHLAARAFHQLSVAADTVQSFMEEVRQDREERERDVHHHSNDSKSKKRESKVKHSFHLGKK